MNEQPIECFIFRVQRALVSVVVLAHLAWIQANIWAINQARKWRKRLRVTYSI